MSDVNSNKNILVFFLPAIILCSCHSKPSDSEIKLSAVNCNPKNIYQDGLTLSFYGYGETELDTTCMMQIFDSLGKVVKEERVGVRYYNHENAGESYFSAEIKDTIKLNDKIKISFKRRAFNFSDFVLQPFRGSDASGNTKIYGCALDSVLFNGQKKKIMRNINIYKTKADKDSL